MAIHKSKIVQKFFDLTLSILKGKPMSKSIWETISCEGDEILQQITMKWVYQRLQKIVIVVIVVAVLSPEPTANVFHHLCYPLAANRVYQPGHSTQSLVSPVATNPEFTNYPTPSCILTDPTGKLLDAWVWFAPPLAH